MQVDDKRQHISDAAWERQSPNGGLLFYREYWEKAYKRDGLMLVTVEEWDALTREPEPPIDVDWNMPGYVFADGDKVWKIDYTTGTVTSNTDEPCPQIGAEPEEKPRDTSWPAPAHRARWIPFL